MPRQFFSRLGAIAALTLAYFVAGNFGLSLAVLNTHTTAIWPPTGIALAALLTLGYGVWPAIFFGALLVNLAASGLTTASLMIAVGNTAAILVAVYLINSFARGRRAFDRAQDIFKFVFIVALSSVVGATVGVTDLVFNDLARWDEYPSLWVTWWFGDLASALILAPALVLWANSDLRKLEMKRVGEAAVLVLSLIAVALVVFADLSWLDLQSYPVQPFLLLPLTWLAFRFGVREIATANVALAAIAIWGTLDGFGPFAGLPSHTSLLLLQASMSIVTTTGLVLGAVVAEHRRVQESQRWLATIVESSEDAIIGKTLDGTILSWNHGAERMYGYSAQEAIGQSISIVVPPFRFNEMPQLLERISRGERIEHYETFGKRKDGGRLDVSLTISPIKDADGIIRGASTIARDLTERKLIEERVRFLAEHDALTGLPNRLLLRDRLTQAIAHARRNGQQVAVLFLDLDGFKHINDSLGHHVGDRVLRMTARRLQGCLRDGDTIARTGGDEFVINLPALTETGDAMLVAGKVLEELREPFVVDKHQLHISGSVGISLYPADGEDALTLMRSADIAMYHAKEKGRNNFQFFTQRLNVAAERRLTVANRLHEAWKRDELMLDYQPQIDLANNRVFAAEALLRWRQPDLGRVVPNEFIKVAEETGMMAQLGEWVLRRACEQVSQWRRAGYSDLRVAVNLSAQQFRQPGFHELVRDVLNEAALPPDALEIEITEGVLMTQTSENIAVLEELARTGVRLAMDDFGTGYSSLAYLQRFPIHTLKIDRSFVKGIGKDDNDTTIVTAIIALAHSLNMRVVAEGVETNEQAAFLRARDCEAAQGFFYSRPLPPRVFAEMLGRPAVMESVV